MKSTEESVPDLYDLAFMPGCFRCPKCGFVLSKATLSARTVQIGITEKNRESEQCPNDGTFMVHVTYREQLAVYADRVAEDLEANAKLTHERDSFRAMAAAVIEKLDPTELYAMHFPFELDPEQIQHVTDILFNCFAGRPSPKVLIICPPATLYKDQTIRDR